MAQNDTQRLSPKQHKTIAALVSSPTVEAAALAAGVGERTVRRWLSDPAFRMALGVAESDVIDGAVRAMLADLDANRAVMREIRDDYDYGPAVRLRAAVALSDDLLRWRELRNVEARLVALEAAYLGAEGKL
jgi:hypothetical protein